MADFENIDSLRNATVYGEGGDKIGSVGEVYLDDQTKEPTFVTVKTGLFGTHETFVPMGSASIEGGDIRVPYTKDFIKDAPNIAADGKLSPEEEQNIYSYYSLEYGDTAGVGTDPDLVTGTAVGGAAGGVAGGVDTDRRGAEDVDADLARDRQLDADDATVAHEERLRVGTESREAGKVRLRKHVTTDTQRVDVPVQREEVVVDRQPIDPDSPEARAGGIDATADSEETITLREERPVVNKETVATEKVNVDKRAVQDTAHVEGEVRREEIDVDSTEGVRDDETGRRGDRR